MKLKLQRKDEKKAVKNKDKKSTETQYLRTDANPSGNMKKVKNNMDQSLKIQNNANKWLMQNERLVSVKTINKLNLFTANPQSQSKARGPKC